MDDSYAGLEDIPISGNVLANDYDPEGDIQKVNPTPISLPLHGAVVLNTDGTFVYKPDPGYNGPDRFVYEVCDNALPKACDQATVYLLVIGTNDPPVAINDVNTTLVNTPVSGNVLTNDNEPDGDALVINTTPVIPPAHGSLVIYPDGTYVYTPDPGYTGTDKFVYEVCDANNPPMCDQAMVTIVILDPDPDRNDPPVAIDDAYQGSINETVKGKLLSNDWDPDGNLNNSSVTLIGPGPGNGIFVLYTDGSFSFIPTNGFTGQVKFNYRICDLGIPALCDTGMVTIDIMPNPDGNSTFAADDSYLGKEDTPISGNVLNNDYDPQGHKQVVKTVPVLQPKHGTVTLNENGTFVYTTDAGYDGPDQFVYEICDDGVPVACDRATVYLLIPGTNDPPVALNDINITAIDTPVSGNVLTNDLEPDGDPIAVNTTPVVLPLQGSVVINPDGSYTYTPDPGYTGNDSFIYEICDNGNPPLCDQATVKIIILNPDQLLNDPPVALDDSYAGTVNLPIKGNVIMNDDDPDGNLNGNSIVQIGPAPANGSLVLNPNGTFTFIPNPGFIGKTSFAYRVCDLGIPSLCDTAVVTIHILPNPDGNSTFATDDAYITDEDVPVTGNVLANDYDPEGNKQTVNTIPLVMPQHGTLTLNSDGTFIFKPAKGYTGPDQFVYEVCDDGIPAECKKATVYLLILFVNEPPQIACPGNKVADAAKTSCDALIGGLSAVYSDPDDNIVLVTWTMTGATNASSSPTGIYNLESYRFNAGITTVKYTVTDAYGLKATCSFTVTVADKTPPTLGACCTTICVSLKPTIVKNRFGVFIEARGTISQADLDAVRASASDNCTPNSELVITYSQTEFTDKDVTGDNCGNGIPKLIKVTVTDAAGNKFVCDCFGVMVCLPVKSAEIGSSVKIELDESEPLNMTVYPNPTKGKLNLDIRNLNNPDVTVAIYNMAGSLVLQKQFRTEGKIDLDLTGNVSGTYLMVVYADQRRFEYKIILTQ
jgi:hypothetical protein